LKPAPVDSWASNLKHCLTRVSERQPEPKLDSMSAPVDYNAITEALVHKGLFRGLRIRDSSLIYFHAFVQRLSSRTADASIREALNFIVKYAS
jgi:hypothetical protein